MTFNSPGLTRLVVAAMLTVLAAALPRPGAAQGAVQVAAQGAAASPPVAAFTPAQRTEIVAILRDALTRDPSILRDAVASLRAEDARTQEASARMAIGSARGPLLGASGDPVAGNPAGDVTVVEFYDLRCPYCRRMQPVLDQLLTQDHGVRLVLKDLPILGPGSVLGARAVLAAQRQGGYQKLQEAVLRGPADITEATLQEQARAVGLDWPRLQADMADASIQARIDANLSLARALSIDGTPAMIIGDHLIPGAISLADLQAAVGQARGK